MAVRPRPLAGWTPLCAACSRRLVFADSLPSWHASTAILFQQQLRGKKTKKEPSTVIVQLLKDTNRYGKKGTILPVAGGHMRNLWYPRGTATYVTAEKLLELKTKNVPIARDFLFHIKRKGSEQTSEEGADPSALVVEEATKEFVPILQAREEVKLLSPDRALQLIDLFVPPRLDFYRTTIEPQPPPAQSGKQRNTDSTSAAATAPDLLFDNDTAGLNPAIPVPTPPTTATTGGGNPPSRTPIFGSVTTADLANTIRALLADNDEAARVVLSAEDIQFVKLEEGDERDRVKFIGEYEVEVRVRGKEEAVKRVVRVLATVSE